VRQTASLLVVWVFICALVAAVVVTQVRAQDPRADELPLRAVALAVSREPAVAGATAVPGRLTGDVGTTDSLEVLLTPTATTTQIVALLDRFPGVLERQDWREEWLPLTLSTADGDQLSLHDPGDPDVAEEAPTIRAWMRATARLDVPLTGSVDGGGDGRFEAGLGEGPSCWIRATYPAPNDGVRGGMAWVVTTSTGAVLPTTVEHGVPTAAEVQRWCP
jgi:hypothetical protein